MAVFPTFVLEVVDEFAETLGDGLDLGDRQRLGLHAIRAFDEIGARGGHEGRQNASDSDLPPFGGCHVGAARLTLSVWTVTQATVIDTTQVASMIAASSQ